MRVLAAAEQMLPGNKLPAADAPLTDQRLSEVYLDIALTAETQELEPLLGFGLPDSYAALVEALKADTRASQLTGIIQWLRSASREVALDALTIYPASMLYDDLEWFLFEGTEALMAICMSSETWALFDDFSDSPANVSGLDGPALTPAHALGAALAQCSFGFLPDEDQLAALVPTNPFLAFLSIYFLLPGHDENPLLGMLERGEDASYLDVPWERVQPVVVDGLRIYNRICNILPSAAQLQDVGWLFRQIVAVFGYA
ncbi:MAG: hypothetical protein JXB38_02630 [Anaerolineales bacterium]|nr:hypothetical protein [Anaerolineales bacterium]